MTLSRRQFLTRAIATVPVVLAGEQLIELLAPKRMIFLPPRCGWGGRSTLQLLRAYCDSMRPLGLRIDCEEMDMGNMIYEISERDYGWVRYTISRQLDPAVERRMRIALLNPPNRFISTRADLTPWDTPHVEVNLWRELAS